MSDSEDSEDSEAYNIYDYLDIQYDAQYDHLGTNNAEYDEKIYNIYDNFFNHIPDENIIFHIYDSLSFLSLSKLSTTSKDFYNHINTYLNDITIKNKILFSYKHILYDKHYYNKFPSYNMIIDHYIANKYNYTLFKELLNVTTKEKINTWSKQLRINNFKYKDKNIHFINSKKRKLFNHKNNKWNKLIIKLL